MELADASGDQSRAMQRITVRDGNTAASHYREDWCMMLLLQK